MWNFFPGDITEKRRSTILASFQKLCPGIKTPKKDELIILGSSLGQKSNSVFFWDRWERLLTSQMMYVSVCMSQYVFFWDRWERLLTSQMMYVSVWNKELTWNHLTYYIRFSKTKGQLFRIILNSQQWDFELMKETKKLYWKSLVPVSFFMDPSFIPVWEVGIPYPLNWEQSNTREKNGRNLSKNTCYNFTKIAQLFIRTIFGTASNFSNSSKVLLYFNFILITTPTVPNKLFLFYKV